MPEKPQFTPSTAASTLSHWLNAAEKVGIERFPVDVAMLAREVGKNLNWPDQIVEIKAANIPNFEGGLFQLNEHGWALLYNDQIVSPGRVRLTQAHELGHYMLHRNLQQSFECSQADLLQRGEEHEALEKQADDFACNLLMPMTQFRTSTAGAQINFEILSDASTKFGVSLTAASLRWIRSTEESAILVLSRDGYIDWSVSSSKAMSNGAYIKTRKTVVELPEGSLAADEHKTMCRVGERIALKTWFQHAHPDAIAREMKICCDNYGYTLSLLHLSSSDKVWAPKEWSSKF